MVNVYRFAYPELIVPTVSSTADRRNQPAEETKIAWKTDNGKSSLFANMLDQEIRLLKA